jgi:hypothetical protein
VAVKDKKEKPRINGRFDDVSNADENEENHCRAFV